MRRRLLIATLLAVLSGLCLPTALLADPGGPNLQQPISLTCTNGQQVVVNPGTVINQGRVAWTVGSTSVLVTMTLAFTDGTDTFVLFEASLD